MHSACGVLKRYAISLFQTNRVAHAVVPPLTNSCRVLLGRALLIRCGAAQKMGSGRDKRKKKKGITPGVGAEKTEKKTERNSEKLQRRDEKKAQA